MNGVILKILLVIMLIFSMPTYVLSNQYSSHIAHFYGLKSDKNLTILNVKGYQQTEDYTCGPASIMSLMYYYGMLKDKEMNHETEVRIAKEMGTSEDSGTTPMRMATWLKQHGFDVQSGENGTLDMLQANLKKGIPTIVEWVDWGGHWVVTTGYDVGGKKPSDDKDTIFFADPSAHFDNVKYINGVTTFNPDRFASMWFDAQYFNPGHLVKGIYIVAVPKKSH